MRRLIANLVPFCALVIASYWLLFARTPRIERDMVAGLDDPIRAWGDSRLYRGLDPEALGRGLGRPVVSWARHGAGVYDLEVFVDRAPERCDAIVGVSLAMLLRENNRDYHRSGLSARGLYELARHGWSFDGVLKVFLDNRDGGDSPVHVKPKVYPARPEPRPSRARLALYRGFAADRAPRPQYLAKQVVLRRAIERLLGKKCRVAAIEFPVHPTFAALRQRSIYRDYLGWLEQLAAREDRLELIRAGPSFHRGDNAFHDYSHLNRRGRERMTRLVIDALARRW